MAKKQKEVSLKQLVSWAGEAQLAAQGWRADSWEDYEFRDGKQWSDADLVRMEKLGIRPLTINRTFPVLNLLNGQYLNNPNMVVAKGRTKQDNELGQVMSEAITYVGDQCRGPLSKKQAFDQAITAGIGFLEVGYDTDPRKERVAWWLKKWYSVWWDPYASPWLRANSCRYAMTAEWTDLDALAALFPEKRKEILEQFEALSVDDFVPDIVDEGTTVEEVKRFVNGSSWANAARKRVRPIEMWYTVLDRCFFAKFPDGRVIDLDTLASPNEEYEVVQRASEVLTANVRKMRVASLLGGMKLQDVPTPYPHDEYPYVPYIGYLDRFEQPFGVPRQIKEQDSEVNKRRSMALSLMSSRRIITEEDASTDENKTHREANRQDGFVVMKKGKMDRIKIEEMGVLAPEQMSVLQSSEREIQEIAGSYDVQPRANIRSEGMMERQENTQASITASLLDNAKMSDGVLAERVMALIQDTWTDEKVLRVTDRVTGAEKFVALNERYLEGTTINVRNNITQGRFDIVMAPTPMTATMREKNMENIFAAINKSPPEAVGPLINLALEISDLPDKEQLLAQLRQATGWQDFADMTTEEREAMEAQQMEEEAAQAEKQQAQEDQAIALENNVKIAEAEKLRAEAELARKKAGVAQQDVDQKGFQIGNQAAQMVENNKKEGPTRSEESHSKSKPKGENKDKGATK